MHPFHARSPPHRARRQVFLYTNGEKLDGEWKQHTKTGLQCYLKYRVGVHAKLEIDGKFHGRSISALQVLPRKIPARKNPEIWSLKLGIFRASSFHA